MDDGSGHDNGGNHSRLIPTTKIGQLSVRLLVASLIVFVVAVVISLAIGDDEPEGLIDVLRLLLGIAFLFTGLGALVTAAIALIRDHERALLVWLALAFGIFATALVLGDIVVPLLPGSDATA